MQYIGQAAVIISTESAPYTIIPGSGLFALELYYDEQNSGLQGANDAAGTPRYNGDIAWMQWAAPIMGDGYYGFEYDPLNRIRVANFSFDGNFTETENEYGARYSYADGRGNIEDLWRRGPMINSMGQTYYQAIDSLQFEYMPDNTIYRVTEQADPDISYRGTVNSYGYSHGNITTDPVRDITEIKYNILNLPYEVTFLNGSKIKVVYDGDGQVWRKILTSTTDTLPNGLYTMTIDYIDGFEYHDEVFASYTHPQGRVAPGPDGINCEYFLRDHLGSVRVIYADIDRDRSVDFNEEECELLEEFHYYPFGMEMSGMWQDMRLDQHRNRNTYNGKPAQTEMGWDWLNYGARYYDPMVGRWNSVDPLAEKYSSISPYAYVLNNPIRHTDPDGRSVDGEYEQDKNGNWVKVSNKGDAIGVDFYHFNASGSKPQQTYVTDREGNWNVINNGRYALQGEARGSDVNWKTIYNEFSSGTGPERSVFEGNHPSNIEIQGHYGYQEALSSFVASGQSKAGTEVSFSPLDISKTGVNMQAQMMGSYNASFYKLGDKTLSLLQDSKSRTSLYYHLPVTNYSRTTGRYTSDFNPNTNLGLGPYTGYKRVHTTSETNTYQSYLFLNR